MKDFPHIRLGLLGTLRRKKNKCARTRCAWAHRVRLIRRRTAHATRREKRTLFIVHHGWHEVVVVVFALLCSAQVGLSRRARLPPRSPHPIHAFGGREPLVSKKEKNPRLYNPSEGHTVQ